VHQPDEETEVVATMTNTADLTDPQSKGFPAKDPRAIETVQEHQRGIREIRMGPSEVIGRIARGLGGLLLMPVILVRSFAAPLAVTRYHHSRCLALKPRQTMLAHHTSGNHFLRNRCLALMGQGKSLAPHLSASLYLHSRCPRPTTRPTTAIEAWVHLPRSRRTPKGSHKWNLRAITLDSNTTPGLRLINRLRVLVLNLWLIQLAPLWYQETRRVIEIVDVIGNPGTMSAALQL
jgi:hypothetical protein